VNVRSIQPIVEKLKRAQTTFLSAVDAVPVEQWKSKPSAEEWSVAEVAAHLVMIERTVIGAADRVTQKVPKEIPRSKRLHLPLWLLEGRIVRRKSPIPLDPALVGSKEELLGELRATRDRTLAFMEETKGRDLSAYNWPHPFLGRLNTYEWFEMIAGHQLRHAKQVREITERLPKVVGISQS
jgi:DinB family protein